MHGLQPPHEPLGSKPQELQEAVPMASPQLGPLAPRLCRIFVEEEVFNIPHLHRNLQHGGYSEREPGYVATSALGPCDSCPSAPASQITQVHPLGTSRKVKELRWGPRKFALGPPLGSTCSQALFREPALLSLPRNASSTEGLPSLRKSPSLHSGSGVFHCRLG